MYTHAHTQALNVADELLRSGVISVVAIDSVSALVPKSELEGDIGNMQVGIQARMMSQALRKLAANASRGNCTIIFLNQIRYKARLFFTFFDFEHRLLWGLGEAWGARCHGATTAAAAAPSVMPRGTRPRVPLKPPPAPHPPKTKHSLTQHTHARAQVGVLYGNPETTSGGNALKFYASVRVDVRAKEKIEGANKEIIGNRVRARCVKNKVSGPYKEAEFDILFGKGIDYLGGIFDAAETCVPPRLAAACCRPAAAPSRCAQPLPRRRGPPTPKRSLLTPRRPPSP